MEPLRIQAEKAQQFIAFDQEKKGLEIGIWLTTLDRSGAVLREHGEKMALAQAQHNELEEEIQSIAQRTEENYRFYSLKDRFNNKFRSLKEQWANRKLYHYYRCPQCRQKLRVPRGRGRIQISCPRCGTQFIKKS